MSTEVPTAVGRYARIASLIASDRCVLLDGATGSELIEVSGGRPELEEHLWGITAIIDAPEAGHDLHRATSMSAAT